MEASVASQATIHTQIYERLEGHTNSVVIWCVSDWWEVLFSAVMRFSFSIQVYIRVQCVNITMMIHPARNQYKFARTPSSYVLIYYLYDGVYKWALTCMISRGCTVMAGTQCRWPITLRESCADPYHYQMSEVIVSHYTALGVLISSTARSSSKFKNIYDYGESNYRA